MDPSPTPLLSVVVPVFGCATSLYELQQRLAIVLDRITEDWEVVYVDDRSPDGAWDMLCDLAEVEPRVRAFRLSRNFGQHATITAGLARVRGAHVVVMDCDLEEPPEAIPELYARALEGFDIVHGSRRQRQHSRFRRWGSRIYRRLLLDVEPHTEYSTLSCISRKVVDAFLSLGDRDREYLLILDWLGFSQTTVEFDHALRPHGESSYSLRELLRVAFDGMFFRTTVLLRVIVAGGFLTAVIGVAVAVYELIVYATVGSPPGYTTLVVLLLLLGGAVLVSIGVVGLYVGRIFEQVKGRPLFVIDEARDDAARHSTSL